MAKITGRDGVTRRFDRLSGREKVEHVGRALFAGGDLIKAEARHSLTVGAVSGANHVPSLPGEPPNQDTGHLGGNIIVEQPAPLRVLVTSNAEYAAVLEFGGVNVEERPYMRPATEKKRKEVVAMVKGAVTIVTKRR